MIPEQVPNNLQKTHNPKLIFWARMGGWFLTGCVAPIATFAVKFGLFTKAGYTIAYDSLGNVVQATKPALNGWGIISCLIIWIFIGNIVKEIIKSYTGYSLAKQFLTGIVKTVLPLVTAFFICYFLRDVLDNIMFCLGVLAITQLVAIPLNPLPQWRYLKNQTEDYTDAVNTITAAVVKKVKGGDK